MLYVVQASDQHKLVTLNTEKMKMNKKLAQLVLSAQRDITANGLDYSYTAQIVSILITEYWDKRPAAPEMHELVAAWKLDGDYQSAVALASWLLAQ